MTVTPPQIPAGVLKQRDQLIQIYVRAQRRLAKQLTGATLTDFARFRIQEQLVQLNAIIGALNAEVKDALPGLVPAYYRHGADLAGVAMQAQGVKISALNLGSRIHTAAIQAVAEQMALDLAKANTTMRESGRRILRQTQQTLVQEKQINKIIAEGLVTGESRRETSARLKEALQKQVGEGKFVSVGKFNYTPEYYAELVTRTRTREAVTQGAVTRSMEFGITLFQVSIHDNPCPRCAQYQGKVYSVTPDSGFPMLENRPPFHPHCAAPETEVIAPGLRAAYESWYEGPMVRLKLGNGRTVTVTSNHYFLTPERFIKAGEITAETRLVFWPGFANGKRIDDVAINNCRSASTFRTGDGAFHGDGAFMRGDLALRIMACDPLAGIRGSFGDLARIASVTGDPTRRDNSNEVNLQGLARTIDAPMSSTGIVPVLSVEHIEYRGFVYDLETATGLYYAEGLVSSNCRHVLLPYVQRPGKEAQHEAIKAFSNIPAPGAPGYDAAVAQARATGGLRKKQLPGETRTVTPPVQAGPTGEFIRKRIVEVAERSNGSLESIKAEVAKLYPGNPSPERTAAPLKFKATASMPKAVAEAKFNEGVNAFFRMVSENSLPQGAFKPAFHSQKSRRAFYSLERQEVNLQHDDEQRTIIHEMGHWLEHKNTRIAKAANAYLEARTKGEVAQTLRRLTGNSGYRSDEIAKKDKFKHPYTGKIYARLTDMQARRYGYPEGLGLRTTEITSMGLEAMFENPRQFAEDDPDFFDFIWDVIMSGKEYP